VIRAPLGSRSLHPGSVDGGGGCTGRIPVPRFDERRVRGVRMEEGKASPFAMCCISVPQQPESIYITRAPIGTRIPVSEPEQARGRRRDEGRCLRCIAPDRGQDVHPASPRFRASGECESAGRREEKMKGPRLLAAGRGRKARISSQWRA
jgi:hypothetical protein